MPGSGAVEVVGGGAVEVDRGGIGAGGGGCLVSGLEKG
jgi:hypothetical protein